MYNTIAIFLEMPEASRRSEALSESVQAILDAKGTWSPTIELANEAMKQLSALGIASTVAQQVKPMQGVENRGATLLMENWLAPIRAYYNDSTPVQEYRTLASNQLTFVLEVGILNYAISLSGDKLLLQVIMKMIDSTDGRVIGRARAANALDMPTLKPLDQAFDNNAFRFKQVYLETGRQLVRKCLAKLGFSSPTN